MKNVPKIEIYRIIDANLNRSREGLRVCEDIARFVIGSRTLTKEIKTARHDISDLAVSASLDPGILHNSRDPIGDIGRVSGTGSEMRRNSLNDIFTANMERAKESIRVLEEFFKLIDKKTSNKFSGLRFRVYEIEKMATRVAKKGFSSR